MILIERIIVFFEFRISGLTLAIYGFPGGGLREGDFIGSGSYYWAVSFVKCPELCGKIATEGGVYVGKSGCREDFWTWNLPERVEVEVG